MSQAQSGGMFSSTRWEGNFQLPTSVGGEGLTWPNSLPCLHSLSLQAMPLISRGRRLVRKGELVQVLLQEVGVSHKPRVTLRPVHLHLFSDLLLLSWRKE